MQKLFVCCLFATLMRFLLYCTKASVNDAEVTRRLTMLTILLVVLLVLLLFGGVGYGYRGRR